MATQQSTPAEATAENYAAQAAIGAALVDGVEQAWSLLDPTRLAETLPLLIKALIALIRQHSQASRGLALTYYEQMRRLEGITTPFKPTRIELPPAEQVEKTTKWATDALWSTTGGTLPDGDTIQTAMTVLAAATEQIVLDTGRDQLIANVEQDREAIGFAREAKPDACWWCSMLATRGMVYATAYAAGRRDPNAGEAPIGLDDQGKEWVNRYHRNCRCQVVPVFVAYEPPAHVREWQDLWEATMRPNGPGGPGEIHGMENMQAAWKEALAQHRRRPSA